MMTLFITVVGAKAPRKQLVSNTGASSSAYGSPNDSSKFTIFLLRPRSLRQHLSGILLHVVTLYFITIYCLFPSNDGNTTCVTKTEINLARYVTAAYC